MRHAPRNSMFNVETAEVPVDAWEKTRDADEDSCAARRAKGLPAIPCPRGSQCHCGRPIGHPIPIPPRDPRSTARA